jgi:hypothetical protein
MAKTSNELTKAELEDVAKEIAESPDMLLYRLSALVELANRKREKEPDLHKFISDHPDLFDKVGLISNSVRSAIIRKLSGEAEGTRVSLKYEYEAFIKRLSSEDDSPLERLMIERIGMCWLRVLYAENACTMLMGTTQTFKQFEFADRQLGRAHARYVKAVESLARHRAILAAGRAAAAQAEMAEHRASEARMRKSQRALKLAGCA